jgi:hypothetical protein
MDAVFAALHQGEQRPVVNAEKLIARAMVSAPFDFEHKRHAFFLYSIGALPLPVIDSELKSLASQPDNLAGLILLKIIQNHGRTHFIGGEKSIFLLDVISTCLTDQFWAKGANERIRRPHSPAISYASHVFNHGLGMFLDATRVGTREYRFAAALNYVCAQTGSVQPLMNEVIEYFMRFAQGHFLDVNAAKDQLIQITSIELGEREAQTGSDMCEDSTNGEVRVT